MFTVYAVHGSDPARLEQVKEEMAILGRPVIEVVDCGDYYRALEGSHRLAAADALGLIPELVIGGQADEIDISRYDWFDHANWAETIYRAGEVAAEIHAPILAVAYSFAR